MLNSKRWALYVLLWDRPKALHTPTLQHCCNKTLQQFQVWLHGLVRFVATLSSVWVITWMSANEMHLIKWTVALVQVTPSHLDRCSSKLQIFMNGTQPSATYWHSAKWSPLLIIHPSCNNLNGSAVVCDLQLLQGGCMIVLQQPSLITLETIATLCCNTVARWVYAGLNSWTMKLSLIH